MHEKTPVPPFLKRDANVVPSKSKIANYMSQSLLSVLFRHKDESLKTPFLKKKNGINGLRLLRKSCTTYLFSVDSMVLTMVFCTC